MYSTPLLRYKDLPLCWSLNKHYLLLLFNFKGKWCVVFFTAWLRKGVRIESEDIDMTDTRCMYFKNQLTFSTGFCFGMGLGDTAGGFYT